MQHHFPVYIAALLFTAGCTGAFAAAAQPREREVCGITWDHKRWLGRSSWFAMHAALSTDANYKRCFRRCKTGTQLRNNKLELISACSPGCWPHAKTLMRCDSGGNKRNCNFVMGPNAKEAIQAAAEYMPELIEGCGELFQPEAAATAQTTSAVRPQARE